MHVRSRQFSRLSSCYPRFLGGPCRFSMFCASIAFGGGPIALQCFVHVSDKSASAILQWSSTILTVTHMYVHMQRHMHIVWVFKHVCMDAWTFVGMWMYDDVMYIWLYAGLSYIVYLTESLNVWIDRCRKGWKDPCMRPRRGKAIHRQKLQSLSWVGERTLSIVIVKVGRYKARCTG